MVLSLPKSMVVAEVGPRDGLQSFPRWIETDTKVAIVDRLSDLGLPVIEVSNFAHPKVIPHLRDAEEVFRRIKRRPGTVYRALVPNARGAHRAAHAGVDEMLGLITIRESSPAFIIGYSCFSKLSRLANDCTGVIIRLNVVHSRSGRIYKIPRCLPRRLDLLWPS